MKALSLTQPWATLLVLSEKEWETRSWPTAYRGALAIHASLTFPQWARALCKDRGYYHFGVLLKHGLRGRDLPLGSIIGVCELVDCIPTDRLSLLPTGKRDTIVITKQEFGFGDFGHGRYAFKMANALRLEVPIPCKGALKLWEVPQEVEAQIIAQLQQGE